MTFPWLENALPFFHIFLSEWEPWTTNMAVKYGSINMAVKQVSNTFRLGCILLPNQIAGLSGVVYTDLRLVGGLVEGDADEMRRGHEEVVGLILRSVVGSRGCERCLGEKNKVRKTAQWCLIINSVLLLVLSRMEFCNKNLLSCFLFSCLALASRLWVCS